MDKGRYRKLLQLYNLRNVNALTRKIITNMERRITQIDKKHIKRVEKTWCKLDMNIREEQRMTQVFVLGYSIDITVFAELICLIMRNLVWGVLSLRCAKRTPDAAVR